MRKEGIAVTNAGQLNSNYIIHVETKYKTREWLRPVEQCLKTAEDHGFKSVAFPTLGICKYMYSAASKICFTNEPPHGKTNNLPRRKQRRRSAVQ